MEINIQKHKPENVWILFILIIFLCFHPNKNVSQFSIVLLLVLIIGEVIYKIPEKLVFEKDKIQVHTTDYFGLHKKHKKYSINSLEYFYGKVPTSTGTHYGIRIYLKKGRKRKKQLVEINEDDTSLEELEKIRNELRRVVGEGRKTW